MVRKYSKNNTNPILQPQTDKDFLMIVISVPEQISKIVFSGMS